MLSCNSVGKREILIPEEIRRKKKCRYSIKAGGEEFTYKVAVLSTPCSGLRKYLKRCCPVTNKFICNTGALCDSEEDEEEEAFDD